MPSRVIRGEINASRSLSRVGLEADLTFRALLVSVDDFGRCEADPLMLKATLYPRRPSVTPEMVAAWVAELAAEGCVKVYVVDGVSYLELTGHERHRSNSKRAERSKFPEPPAESRDDAVAASVPENPPGNSGEPRADSAAPESPADPRPSSVCRVAGDEVASSGEDPPLAPKRAVSSETAETPARSSMPSATDEPWRRVFGVQEFHWPFIRAWIERFGEAPARLPEFCAGFDPVERKRANAEILARWRRYLDPAVNPEKPQFLKSAKFVETWDYWSAEATQQRKRGARGLDAIGEVLAETLAEEAAERQAAAGGGA